jgi:hypothetical protein
MGTDLREAAQQALEALMWHDETVRTRGDDEAIEALRAALEQPEQEQEPVSTWYGTDWPAHMQLMAQLAHLEPGTDLYTHPPRREWRGLTEEEIDSVMPYCHNEFDLAEFKDFARAIEAALKEKNHD